MQEPPVIRARPPLSHSLTLSLFPPPPSLPQSLEFEGLSHLFILTKMSGFPVTRRCPEVTNCCVYSSLCFLSLRGRSVESLLCENADYLVNSLSLRLRRIHDNPAAPDVMRVVLQHSNHSVLPLLQDTVYEVSSNRLCSLFILGRAKETGSLMECRFCCCRRCCLCGCPIPSGPGASPTRSHT